ncbi:unnamed protein product [Blepharisma stoltei]|uniref:Nucleosome assembly protein n=1 Tax=Blepharisma stoltei TaxID=1481888 RepID=A0AAU9IH60_9CILI|nr:unnamed protein product [Blepharisma stoltei]
MDPQTTAATEEAKEEDYATEIHEQERKAQEAISALPEEEKQRLQPVLDLQKQRDSLYLAYLDELRALENKYDSLYAPLYVQRSQHTKQIAGFWLKALRSNPMTSTFLYEQDDPLLQHLVDIRCFEDHKSENFKLEFEFTPNEFMENTILTKDFTVNGDEPIKTVGTEIHWKNDKNLTQKIKKTKKKGKKGKVNNVTKVVDNPSFFMFFKSHDGDEEIDEEESDEEGFMNDPLGEDYELGMEIRDEIIPNAALFYLNVRHEEDKSDDEEGHAHAAKIDASGADKPECKQQ